MYAIYWSKNKNTVITIPKPNNIIANIYLFQTLSNGILTLFSESHQFANVLSEYCDFGTVGPVDH